MIRFTLLLVVACSSPAPSKVVDDACYDCEVYDARAERQKMCDTCWKACGQADSFQKALECSMWCTAICNEGSK